MTNYFTCDIYQVLDDGTQSSTLNIEFAWQRVFHLQCCLTKDAQDVKCEFPLYPEIVVTSLTFTDFVSLLTDSICFFHDTQ
jgi:hypothetical protein